MAGLTPQTLTIVKSITNPWLQGEYDSLPDGVDQASRDLAGSLAGAPVADNGDGTQFSELLTDARAKYLSGELVDTDSVAAVVTSDITDLQDEITRDTVTSRSNPSTDVSVGSPMRDINEVSAFRSGTDITDTTDSLGHQLNDTQISERNRHLDTTRDTHDRAPAGWGRANNTTAPGTTETDTPANSNSPSSRPGASGYATNRKIGIHRGGDAVSSEASGMSIAVSAVSYKGLGDMTRVDLTDWQGYTGSVAFDKNDMTSTQEYVDYLADKARFSEQERSELNDVVHHVAQINGVTGDGLAQPENATSNKNDKANSYTKAQQSLASMFKSTATATAKNNGMSKNTGGPEIG